MHFRKLTMAVATLGLGFFALPVTSMAQHDNGQHGGGGRDGGPSGGHQGGGDRGGNDHGGDHGGDRGRGGYGGDRGRGGYGGGGAGFGMGVMLGYYAGHPYYCRHHRHWRWSNRRQAYVYVYRNGSC